MSIKNNFRIGYLTTALLFGILGAIILFGFLRINSKTEEIHKDKIKTMFMVNSMYEEVLESIPDVYEYTVASGAAAKAGFEEKMASYDKFETEYKKLAKIGLVGEDTKEKEIFTNLHTAKVDYQKTVEDIFATFEKRHKLEKNDFENYKTRVEKVHSSMDELFELRKQMIEIASKEVSKTAGNMILAIITIALIVGLIAGIIAIFMWRSIAKPLEALQISVKAIADGDISQRAKVLSSNEIGSLASNFNAMADKIATSQTDMKKANTILEEQDSKLKEQLDQLRKFQKITINREMKMIELKEKLKECERNHGTKS